jgi:7-cyano-7-deazaguanine synthase
LSAPTAVALLSGGMDSVVAAAIVRDDGYGLITLCVDYGQRHQAEKSAARELSRWLGASEHVVLEADLRAVGGSALTDDIDVPREGTDGGIPVTYVPARNTVLLALALSLAEARDARAMVIGANRVDYSGYPDCRPAFLDAFEKLAEVATKAGLEGRAPKLLAPILDLSKAEIVRAGTERDVPFERSVSCYAATDDGAACGRCDACRLRADGFEAAGIADPTRYAGR